MNNTEFLELLESSNDKDILRALTAFENAYETMYEDSDPTDGISDSEVEAIKRRKAQQKKIVKIIALCTAGIATCAALYVVIKKLKAKKAITESQASKFEQHVEVIEDKFKDSKTEVIEVSKQKALTTSESNNIDKMYDEVEKNTKVVKTVREEMAEAGRYAPDAKDDDNEDSVDQEKISAFLKSRGLASDETNFAGTSSGTSSGKNKGKKGKKGKNRNESVDDYDRVVDAILEKFNDDAINAETCIALMERASERYLTESEYSDENSDYESAIDEICESYTNGEISDEMYELMIEAAANKYL